jgi:hypothetical protein
VRIRNKGRRPAFNIKANMLIKDAMSNFAEMSQPFFIQGLLPNESAVVLIQNDSPTALVATVADATVGSVSKLGQDVATPIYLSSAFPMPIG